MFETTADAVASPPARLNKQFLKKILMEYQSLKNIMIKLFFLRN